MNQEEIEDIVRTQKALKALREKREARKEPSVKAMALDLVKGFDALIAAAPDDPEPVAMPITSTTIRAAWGWPEEYVKHPEIDFRAHAEWAAAFDEAQSWIMQGALVAVIGNRGNGKTQLAAEIARAGYFPDDKGEWNGNRVSSNKTALYARSMDFFLMLRAANRSGSTMSELDVLNRFANVGLLCMDEFQERGETDFENRSMTNLLDKRYGMKRPTLLLANQSRTELAQALSASVRDRMHQNGKTIECHWASFRRTQP